MKKLLIAIVAFGSLSAAAEARLVCATAPELKMLQSAALQQQLMVAAMTCHMRADYNRFAATYRDGLAHSDSALKVFFAARPRGEDYRAYKTRMANTALERSVRDPHFCESARRVFDMALGRRLERRGLAPEPPQLVDSGYEGCRAVDDVRLVEARAPKLVLFPKPAPRLATGSDLPPEHAASLQMAKPVPTPKPVVTLEAMRALAPRPRQQVKVQTAWKPASEAVFTPVAVAVAVPKQPVTAKPIAAAKPVAAAKSAAEPLPPKSISALPHRQLANPKAAAVVPPDQSDWDASDFGAPSADKASSRFEEAMAAAPSRSATGTPARYATSESQAQRPHDLDADDPYADNPIPNAYRPGAEWVSDAGPARYGRPSSRGAYWVLDPDGRWVRITPSDPRWRK